MFAIFRREMQAYFLTPVGYIYTGLFLLLTGLFFTFGNLFSGSSRFTGFLGGTLSIFLFAVPVLTMRLFAEEKKQKTDQLFLTSPISIAAVVCGKFFAAMTVYCGTLLVTALYAVVIAAYGDLQVLETVGSYIGFVFLGACYISLGIFISAATENQIASALVCFFVLMIIRILDPLALAVPPDIRTGAIAATVILVAILVLIFVNTKNAVITFGTAVLGCIVVGAFWLFRQDVYFGFVQNIMGWFSLNRRYESFSIGLLRPDSLFYYASFTGFFLFLTVRLIEKRRWS